MDILAGNGDEPLIVVNAAATDSLQSGDGGRATFNSLCREVNLSSCLSSCSGSQRLSTRSKTFKEANNILYGACIPTVLINLI